MKKMLFIYNPRAGKGKIRQQLSEIIELLEQNYCEVVIHPTKSKLDAIRIIEDCFNQEEYQYVVCCGGDGTLNEVVNSIMSLPNKPKIGYLPAGTTNDYAYSLSLPKNLLKVTQLIIEDRMYTCDVGTFNDKYFVYSATFGIFTSAAYQTPQTRKKVIGKLAYLLEGMKELSHWKSYHIELFLKDKVISDQFIYGMITNTKSIGGIHGITGKDVVLNDGEFEGIFIKTPHCFMDILNIIKDLKKGNLNTEFILSFPINKLFIRSREEIPWCIDGEFGGSVQDVDIRNNCQELIIASLLNG